MLQDARHVIVTNGATSHACVDRWIANLVYVARHRRRITEAFMRRLLQTVPGKYHRARLPSRAPPGALARSLENACWEPSHVVAHQDVWRTRTTMVLIHCDPGEDLHLLRTALAWVEARPTLHRPPELGALIQQRVPAER